MPRLSQVIVLMRRHGVLAFCLIALVSLGGCAAKRMTFAQEMRIRNVAVINLVPEQATFDLIGLTALQNERETINMDGRIGDTINTFVPRLIEKSHLPWQLKSITYDRAQLYNLLTAGVVEGGVVAVYHEERLKKPIAELAKANGLDACIVITTARNDRLQNDGDSALPLTFPLLLMASNHFQPDGVGVWMRSTGSASDKKAYVHANIAVSVIDVKGALLVRSAAADDARTIDASAYGITTVSKNNLRPQVLDRLRPDIIEQLQGALKRRFAKLGIV